MTFAQDCTGHTAFSGYGVDSASGKNDIGSLITCGGFQKKKKKKTPFSTERICQSSQH